MTQEKEREGTFPKEKAGEKDFGLFPPKCALFLSLTFFICTIGLTWWPFASTQLALGT